jgi:hypothetical protein
MYLEESYNNLKIVQDQNLLQVQWKTQGHDFIFEKMDFEKLPKGRSQENERRSSGTSKWCMTKRTPRS